MTYRPQKTENKQINFIMNMFSLITKKSLKLHYSRHSSPLAIPLFISIHFYQTSHSVSVFSQTNSRLRHWHSHCFSFKGQAEKSLEKANSKPIMIHFIHLTEQPPLWLKTANPTPSYIKPSFSPSRALLPTSANSSCKKRTPNCTFF